MIIWLQEEINEEFKGNLSEGYMELIEKAADLCLEKEGIGGSQAEHLGIGLSFVDEDEIKELNGQYRQVDEVTDVLSFPMMEGLGEIKEALDSQPGDMGISLGDVVICMDRIRQQAAEYGHSETRELIYLFVHSMLHLMGYDHMNDDDKKKMRAKEEEIMGAMGIDRRPADTDGGDEQ